MKKGRNLIVLVVILALLCGSLVYMNSRPKKNSTTSSSTTDIIKLDSKKITQIDLKTKTNSLTLVKKNNAWQSPSNSGLKLTTSSTDSLVSAFATVEAVKLIGDDITDLEQYGLKDPAGTAVITIEGGTSKTLYLGNQTTDGENYYLMEKNSKKVYTVSSTVATSFNTSLYSLADTTVAQIDSNTLSYFKFTNKGEKPIEFKLNSNQTDAEKNYNLNGWIMTSPYKKEYLGSTDKLQSIIQAIPSIQASGVADTNPADLSKYGLDKPTLDLTVKDSKQNLHFLFGKDMDSNDVYFKIDSSKYVYYCTKSTISSFSVKPFDLISKFAALVTISDVDKIVVQGPQATNTITMTSTTKKATTSGEKDETVTTYKVDGKEVKEDTFKKWYQEIIGLSFDAENDKTVADNPEYKITYYIHTGDKKPIVVDYCPYNSDFYAVYRDGVSEFLVSKDQLTKMQTDLQALIK